MTKSILPLWDDTKIGTAIIGYYRCGTHYLHDIILDQVPRAQNQLQEINTIDEIIAVEKTNKYQIAILNQGSTKVHLVGKKEILKEWHVIRLTRRDKISHFISHWFWLQLTAEEREKNSGSFQHHNTPSERYHAAISKGPVTYDIGSVIVWLEQQLINNFLPYDVCLDYQDLPGYSNIIKWTPNRYGNISLKDLFTNHKEIEDLLINFKSDTYA
jgi:hypothetical protein